MTSHRTLTEHKAIVEAGERRTLALLNGLFVGEFITFPLYPKREPRTWHVHAITEPTLRIAYRPSRGFAKHIRRRKAAR